MEKKRSKLLTKRDGAGNSRRFSSRTERFIGKMADPSTKSQAEAAREAGYSAKTAAQAASRMLTNVEIRAAVEKRKLEAADVSTIDPAAVIGLTVLRAMTTIDDCLDENGKFDTQKARHTGAIHLVKSLTRTMGKYGESVRFEMYSASEAQRELGEYLGIKNTPRENEDRLRRTVQALQNYLLDYPNADREKALRVFAHGSGFSVEELVKRLEAVQQLDSVS